MAQRQPLIQQIKQLTEVRNTTVGGVGISPFLLSFGKLPAQEYSRAQQERLHLKYRSHLHSNTYNGEGASDQLLPCGMRQRTSSAKPRLVEVVIAVGQACTAAG